MKILKFYSEGFKKLKVAEITPDNTIQYISGANEAGKTSVLEAIWATLCWRHASKNITNPINNEAEKAIIALDLGDYVVTRIFGNNGETTQLKITRPNGDTVNAPQKILDGIIGDLAFDPLKFSREDDDKQRQILANVIGIDLNNFDKKRKQIYDNRTDSNKEKVRLNAMLSLIRPPTEEDPKEEKSASDIAIQLQKSLKAEKDISDLKDRIAKDELEFEKIQNRIEENKKLLEIALAINFESPVSLMASLQEVEKRNKRALEVQQYHKIKSELSLTEDNIKKMNAQIELIDIEKDEAIEKASLPIKGLSLTENGILVDSIPWKQLSQAQKIKYSLSIAMASNPNLKVILIYDGSLLDNNSMKIIEDTAKEKEFQVWIEIVDESGEIGVYLEDGKVQKVN